LPATLIVVKLPLIPVALYTRRLSERPSNATDVHFGRSTRPPVTVAFAPPGADVIVSPLSPAVSRKVAFSSYGRGVATESESETVSVRVRVTQLGRARDRDRDSDDRDSDEETEAETGMTETATKAVHTC
jgi:hypothetical protein